jgi:hypothetical protein
MGRPASILSDGRQTNYSKIAAIGMLRALDIG